MKTQAVAWLFCLLILALPIPALADSHGDAAKQETSAASKPKKRAGTGACAEDSERLCPEGPRGKRLRCLGSHYDELSAACRAELDTRAQRAKETGAALRRTCATDIETHCALSAGSATLTCLMGHYEELEPACRDALPKRANR